MNQGWQTPTEQIHPLRLAFGRFICRNYNMKHENETRLHTFKIYFVWRETFYSNKTTSGTHSEIIWEHMCYDLPNNETSEHQGDQEHQSTASVDIYSDVSNETIDEYLEQ